MARPVAADSAETMERIRIAAVACFTQYGISNTKIKQIADEAGVTAPAIYHYFTNRDKLIEYCVHHYYTAVDDVFNTMDQALRSEGSYEERMERAIEAGFKFVNAHRREAQLMSSSYSIKGQHTDQIQNLAVRPLVARAVKAVEESLELTTEQASRLVRYGTISTTRLAIAANDDITEFTHLDLEAAHKRIWKDVSIMLAALVRVYKE